MNIKNSLFETSNFKYDFFFLIKDGSIEGGIPSRKKLMFLKLSVQYCILPWI